MNKIIGGKIPNYINKSELLIDTNENKILSYNVLNRNQNITIFDQNNNIIRYSDTGNIYKLNNDFELEKLPDDTPKIKPTLNQDIFINKEFVINGIKYPYYYIFNNDKFKIAEFLLSENVERNNVIREFILKLFRHDRNDRNKIIDISKSSNLVNKYIFINKFNFLLEILFKNYNGPIPDLVTGYDEALFQNKIKTIIEHSTQQKSEKVLKLVYSKIKQLDDIDLESSDITIDYIREKIIHYSIQSKLKEVKKLEIQLIEILNNVDIWDPTMSDHKILKNNIYHKIKYKLSLPSIDQLSLPQAVAERYNIFYKKFYYIRNLLTTLFSNLNLINLTDLDKFQELIIKSYNTMDTDIERTMEDIIRQNELYLENNIIEIMSDEDNAFNIYLFNEIIEIFYYIDNLTAIKNIYMTKTTNYFPQNRVNDLGMVILLGYFHKRVFDNKTLNVITFDSFPINQNACLSDLFTGHYNLYNDPKNIIKSFYISKLPIYYPYRNVVYKGLIYADCVENSILQFIKTLFWTGESYKLDSMTNPRLRHIFEEYINKNKEETIEYKNYLLEIFNNIDVLDFVNKKNKFGFDSEVISTYKNIVICINYLLTNNEIIDDNRNVEDYRSMNDNILSLSLNENNINLISKFGSIKINYMEGHTNFETSSVLDLPILLNLSGLCFFVSKNLEIFKNNSNNNNYNILTKSLNYIDIDNHNTRNNFEFKKVLYFLLDTNKFDHLFETINFYEKYNFKDIVDNTKENTINNPIFFVDYILLPYIFFLYIIRTKTPPINFKLLNLIVSYLFNNDLFIYFIYNINMTERIVYNEKYIGNELYKKIKTLIESIHQLFITSGENSIIGITINKEIIEKLFTLILFIEIINSKYYNKNAIPEQFLKLLYENREKELISKLLEDINLSNSIFSGTVFLKDYIYYVLDRMINITGEPLEFIRKLQVNVRKTPDYEIINKYIQEYHAKQVPGAALESANKYLKRILISKYLKFKTKYIELKEKLNE